MMHIFTTTRNNWLMLGLQATLQENDADVQVHSVDAVGELLLCTDSHCLPPDSVLLPVFPDNHPVNCLCSLTFLSEWLRLRHRLPGMNAPCLLWGHSPLVRSVPDASGFPVIPWRASPQQLQQQITASMTTGPVRGRRRSRPPCRMRLTPREVSILRHTLEGRSLDWIAVELGVASKTVWTHRRRAMDVLGVRRLHDLMQFPPEVLCASG